MASSGNTLNSITYVQAFSLPDVLATGMGIPCQNQINYILLRANYFKLCTALFCCILDRQRLKNNLAY